MKYPEVSNNQVLVEAPGEKNQFTSQVKTEFIGQTFNFRQLQRADIDEISYIMTYWLHFYHRQSGVDDERIGLLKEIYATNMALLEQFTSDEGLPGYYFYVAEDEEGNIAGTTGFMTNENMDPYLREKLNEMGSYTSPQGNTYDLTQPDIPEIYYLHTNPNPNFHKRGIGNKLMDFVIKEASYVTGSPCMAFSSRSVWEKTAWPFHDKRPDFHLFHDNIKPGELERGTRGYLVSIG